MVDKLAPVPYNAIFNGFVIAINGLIDEVNQLNEKIDALEAANKPKRGGSRKKAGE